MSLVSGQAGDDRIRFSFQGEVNGSLQARLGGGPGRDYVDIAFSVDPSSSGDVVVGVVVDLVGSDFVIISGILYDDINLGTAPDNPA